MHLNGIYHVDLPLFSMVCNTLNNIIVYHLALHPFVALLQLQLSFCWAEENSTAWCKGSWTGMWQQTIKRFRARLCGQIYHCNYTSSVTPLELELWRIVCNQCAFSLFSFCCFERYNYTNIVTLMNFSMSTSPYIMPNLFISNQISQL